MSSDHDAAIFEQVILGNPEHTPLGSPAGAGLSLSPEPRVTISFARVSTPAQSGDNLLPIANVTRTMSAGTVRKAIRASLLPRWRTTAGGAVRPGSGAPEKVASCDQHAEAPLLT